MEVMLRARLRLLWCVCTVLAESGQLQGAFFTPPSCGYPKLSTRGKGFLQEPQNCVMLPKGHRGALFPLNRQRWCEESSNQAQRGWVDTWGCRRECFPQLFIKI